MAHVDDQPTTKSETDTAIVRRCLRELAMEMQRLGTIPADVPAEQIYAEVEKRVPHFVRELRRSPGYHDWKNTDHTEGAPARADPPFALNPRLMSRFDDEQPELDCAQCGRSFHTFAMLDDHMGY